MKLEAAVFLVLGWGLVSCKQILQVLPGARCRFPTPHIEESQAADIPAKVKSLDDKM